MKDEKILKDELMNEEELDQVAGGYNQENIEAFLKNSLNAFSNMNKSLEETMKGKDTVGMMKFFDGGKTSNS